LKIVRNSGKINLLFLLGICVILVIVGVLIYQNLTKEEISMPEKTLENKKIAMIVASKDFRDEEYFVPKEILEGAGAEVKTVSNQTGTAIGADGGEVEVDLLVSDINSANFDAVVFIGGPGCLENLDNENSYKVAKEIVSQDKVLASICISPVILAKAGILKGKKATVWSSPMDKSPVKILEENGAIFEDKPVVVDGKIITGNGPGAAKEFGEKIVEVLTKQ
jgi:protease I